MAHTARRALAVLPLALAAPLGCEVWPTEGNAVIEETSAELDHTGRKIEVWATVNFLQVPEGADPTDVRVVVVGTAAKKQREFDWDYIAQNDYLRTSTGARVEFERTRPGESPVLNQPVDVPLWVHPKDYQVGSANLAVHVMWGGKRQHFEKVDVSHLYEWEEF